MFTNQTCDATQGRQTPEGIHTRTLWGELALQLGGVELYRNRPICYYLGNFIFTLETIDSFPLEAYERYGTF